MRCVKWHICGKRVGSHQKKLCWRKWRMCGECAVIYHPSYYSKTYIKKIRSIIKNQGKRKITVDKISEVLQ